MLRIKHNIIFPPDNRKRPCNIFDYQRLLYSSTRPAYALDYSDRLEKCFVVKLNLELHIATKSKFVYLRDLRKLSIVDKLITARVLDVTHNKI